ncbi:hypothetical protein DF268_31270 [Streptomyces sp. V2]|uniref:hypothetical protein n=1 Tax=Streptomyces TaxID=1883 RepID=UPI000D66C58E|nr:hypothetical protein [Streptomyces sp. V2]PWG09605.1 hypothetical protein DF268_31270 [Streptomyces sp. V2]
MGIESDQVVYEYLSRVGDVAQQQQLASGDRMRLVSELRNEIDQRRAKASADSPAAVRKIIARLGSPDDVVAAAGGGAGTPDAPAVAVPAQPAYPSGTPGPESHRGPAAPADRTGPGGDPVTLPTPRTSDEPLPDWWLKGPVGLESDLDDVPGFVGGVEIPELLKSPRARAAEEKAAKEAKAEKEAPAAPPAGEQAEPAGDPGKLAPRRRRRLIPLPSRDRTSPERPSRTWSNPLLLLAAASLVAGAVLGNLLALGAGWVIAYASRRLSDRETKLAVMWIPGSAVAAGMLWLWGRSQGRWGEPIAEGHMNDAVSETWPWVVRGAAVASALYLVWRSQRNK